MFHISDQETQHGPYSLEKLRTLRANGLVSAEALYWDEAASEWLSLEGKLQQQQPAEPPEPETHAAPSPMAAVSGQAAPRWALKASDFGRRFVAFCLDAVWLIALVVAASELARVLDMWAHEGTFSVVAFCLGLAFRDTLFGGRSLGRRLTFSYVVRRDNLQVVSLGQATKRGLLAALLLAAPVIVGFLAGLLMGKAGGKIGAGIILSGLIMVLKSAAGEGGQSLWDEFCHTIVAVRAKRGDPLLVPATP